MIAGTIIVGLVGIIIIVLGYLLWKKERISLLHDYHYDKVSEENKKAFCALSGMGLLSVGFGLLATAVLLLFTESLWSFIPLVAGLAVGLWLLILAGNTYNR